jgi:hypothetical protein
VENVSEASELSLIKAEHGVSIGVGVRAWLHVCKGGRGGVCMVVAAHAS